MSKLFNLSIEDYKKEELEDLLGLQFPYSFEDVHNSGLQMKKKMLEDTSLNADEKEKIRVFIEIATKKLFEVQKISKNYRDVEESPRKAFCQGILDPE